MFRWEEESKELATVELPNGETIRCVLDITKMDEWKRFPLGSRAYVKGIVYYYYHFERPL